MSPSPLIRFGPPSSAQSSPPDPDLRAMVRRGAAIRSILRARRDIEMARMVKCAKLGRELPGSVLRPLQDRAGQEDLRFHLARGLEDVGRALEDDRQRVPARPRLARKDRRSCSSRPRSTSSAKARSYRPTSSPPPPNTDRAAPARRFGLTGTKPRQQSITLQTRPGGLRGGRTVRVSRILVHLVGHLDLRVRSRPSYRHRVRSLLRPLR